MRINDKLIIGVVFKVIFVILLLCNGFFAMIVLDSMLNSHNFMDVFINPPINQYSLSEEGYDDLRNFVDLLGWVLMLAVCLLSGRVFDNHQKLSRILSVVLILLVVCCLFFLPISNIPATKG